jgi:hypothetical protein
MSQNFAQREPIGKSLDFAGRFVIRPEALLARILARELMAPNQFNRAMSQSPDAPRLFDTRRLIRVERKREKFGAQ